MEIYVSKCMYYNDFCYETNQLCKDVDDKYCTYKQLQQLKAYIKEDLAPTCQRLQKENEELKEKLEQADEDIKAECTRCALTNKLEQENEELKERLKCNCFDSKSKQNRCTSYKRMAEDYERDLKDLKQLKAENEKYKQCLDEIKVIVSKGVKIHDDIIVNKQILQLIKQTKEGK